MPPPTEQVQSAQELILKIDESELSEQMEMERFLVLARNRNGLDGSVESALGSALTRRRFEEEKQLPRGSLDCIAFLRSSEYMNRFNEVIEEYNTSGTLRDNPNAVIDLIIESGKRYDELIPFLVRAKFDFLSSLFPRRENHFRVPVSSGKGVELFTSFFPLAPVAVANLAIAVNAAGFTSIVVSVKAVTTAVVATSLGFVVDGDCCDEKCCKEKAL